MLSPEPRDAACLQQGIHRADDAGQVKSSQGAALRCALRQPCRLLSGAAAEMADQQRFTTLNE